jgi:hypothetical protein
VTGVQTCALPISPPITVNGLSGTLYYNVFITATGTGSAGIAVKSLVGNQLIFESTQAGPYDFSFIGMYLV